MHRADNGGQKARSTGENAKQPFQPLRGECRVFSAEPVVPAACLFCCRRAMGAASARHSPCPLTSGGRSISKPRTQQAPRDGGAASGSNRSANHDMVQPRRNTAFETGVFGPDPVSHGWHRAAQDERFHETYRFQIRSPHPEERAFARRAKACVSKDGRLHGRRSWPSFETHRLRDAPQDEVPERIGSTIENAAHYSRGEETPR